MIYHEAFSKQTFFRDCITFNNFIGFVVAREYICHIESLPSITEAERHAFYMFLLKLLRGDNSSVINCLKNSECMSPYLLDAVLKRLEFLRDLGELVDYVHPNCVKKALVLDNLEMDDFIGIAFHQSSLIGQFLRRFAIGFQLQSFEQTASFCDKFFAYYDVVLSPNSGNGGLQLEENNHSSVHSSVNQVARFSKNICTKIGQIGSLTFDEFKKLTEDLSKFQKLYPAMPTLHFAAHLLAIRCRDFTRAETELYKAFEIHISGNSVQVPEGQNKSSKDLKPADAWTQMALAAVEMHHRFGHDQQARAFLRQALRQALETNDGACLRQVKVAHAVINSSNEPFRYGTLETSNKNHISEELLLSELRTKMMSLMSLGTAPHELLLLFFNSEVASKAQAFPVVMLDLALVIGHYGYPVLATTLLQCVVIADCHRPCPISDEILSTSISQLARSFATTGSPSAALKIIDAADSIIGRFDEKSILDRARLETQLEQALRMGSDLGQCDRFTHSLALFCPWEATVRCAEVELRRNNRSHAILLLQTVVNAAAEIRNSPDVVDSSSSSLKNEDFEEECSLRYRAVDEEDDEDGFLKHQRIPHLNCPPIGGISVLVRFELRARIAMVEIYLLNELLSQAEQQLYLVSSIASAFHLDLFQNISILLLYSIKVKKTSNITASTQHIPLPNDVFRALCGICHQTEMSLRLRLVNLIAWATAVSNANEERQAVVSMWVDHLRNAATFYASTGNQQALQHTADLFIALQSGAKSDIFSNSTTTPRSLDTLLFPISV